MARVAGEILIERPVEEVFDFVADERNEPRYNPRMAAAELVSGEPIGPGSTFRAELRTRGRTLPMTIEFTEFDRPRRLGSLTHSAMMDTVGALSFEPVTHGTRMRWSWEVRPRGALGRMPAVVEIIGRRQERSIWGNLKRLLEAGPSAGDSGATADGHPRSERGRRGRVGGPRRRAAPVPAALRLASVILTGPWSRRPVRAPVDEAAQPLPGDELIPGAKISWTHAITIEARPADVWPWLAQMGCRRAGWYSYDGLDNGGVRSAERIAPELQQVRVGDIFPMTPTARDGFVVRIAEPHRVLVLGDAAGLVSWAFVLKPLGATGTRLITRSRSSYDRLAVGLALELLLRPVHFGMQRRQLLNLKRRAAVRSA